jgi:prepilin-type N-terminal cleavage/methylation domain-containing protein
VPAIPGLPPLKHAQTGYTLLELLVVLGLMGMFTAWALHARPSRVALAAVALRTQLLQARYAAIERNEPVAVVYRDAEQTFLSLAAGELGLPEACESGKEIARLRLREFPRVRATKVPPNGVVWLPSGTGRTCTGSGAFNQTIALADPVREARVIVSRAGRVRSEVAR